MNNKMLIDTNQVRQIASNMAKTNDEIKTTLETAQKRITALDSVWKGEAATASINAINAFAAQYFQNYYNLINEYIEFLKRNVADAYEETESVNTNLADSFK